jgi:hypothetical protein
MQSWRIALYSIVLRELNCGTLLRYDRMVQQNHDDRYASVRRRQH